VFPQVSLGISLFLPVLPGKVPQQLIPVWRCPFEAGGFGCHKYIQQFPSSSGEGLGEGAILFCQVFLDDEIVYDEVLAVHGIVAHIEV